jgi:hypothetical protein
MVFVFLVLMPFVPRLAPSPAMVPVPIFTAVIVVPPAPVLPITSPAPLMPLVPLIGILTVMMFGESGSGVATMFAVVTDAAGVCDSATERCDHKSEKKHFHLSDLR